MSLLVSGAVAVGSCLADAPDDGQPALLRRLEWPAVVEVRITLPPHDVRENESDKVRYPADCAAFVLTPQRVAHYFSVAWQISEQDYLHTIDFDPCQAFGEVRFADGRHGRWGLMQSGGGTLTLTGQGAIHVWCDACLLQPAGTGETQVP